MQKGTSQREDSRSAIAKGMSKHWKGLSKAEKTKRAKKSAATRVAKKRKA